MTDTDYSIETEENKIIINGELELRLWLDTEDEQGIKPTEYEWLDEGAFGLYNHDKETGVQVQMIQKAEVQEE